MDSVTSRADRWCCCTAAARPGMPGGALPWRSPLPVGTRVSIDLRGHGHSDWSPDGIYGLSRFAGDVHAIVDHLGRPPALVGASLGGLSSIIAVGEIGDPGGVLVGARRCRPARRGGRPQQDRRFHAFRVRRLRHARRGRRLDRSVRAAPTSPDRSVGPQKNLRQRGDGRWYWHWDPRFITNREGVDGQEGLVNHERLCAAARQISIPTMLVRGRMSDIVSDESVASCTSSCRTPRWSTSPAPDTWLPVTRTTPSTQR